MERRNRCQLQLIRFCDSESPIAKGMMSMFGRIALPAGYKIEPELHERKSAHA
jgi:hypothetical protein